MPKDEKVIIIQGCPGTGKTSISKKLSQILNAFHIDISKFIIEEKIKGYFDYDSSSFMPDYEFLLNKIIKIINDSNSILIIEGHYADIVPSKYVIKVFVLRLHPLHLEKMLEHRGWDKRKIYENVLAELLDVCLINALEAYSPEKIIEINVTNRSIDEVVNEIIYKLNMHNKRDFGKINWLEELEREGILEKYLIKLSSSP